MNQDYSLIYFILNASFVVKLVILLLVSASIISWTIILQKYSYFKKTKEKISKFKVKFWNMQKINELELLYGELHEKIVKNVNIELSELEHVFYSGFNEFIKLSDYPIANVSQDIIESSDRAMKTSIMIESEKLEANLSFLATAGSVSPYIGLFGTIWGIMNAFRSLSFVEQATISMVAPGISEALVTTAIGLFTAIPAVIAYNKYSAELESIVNSYFSFSKELSNILHRLILSKNIG